MKSCRICASPIQPFIDFGQMPIGNAFLAPEQLKSEYLYHMQVAVCNACSTLQVIDVPCPNQMFHESYAYFASTSSYMTAHFKSMSMRLIKEFLSDDDSFVIEIGCNDGITLQNFSNSGIRHLGIEPSMNVADAARAKGIQVESAFFNDVVAQQILKEHGTADVVIATNTMHHIEDINAVASGVASLLKPTGVFVTEDPYLGDMIEATAYDQLYAEHMYIWSITSLNNVYGRHGLEIFDVEPNPHHGGCMRYYACLRNAYPGTTRLEKFRRHEANLALEDGATYDAFRAKCETSRERLCSLLTELSSKGARVVGYGATAKSATVINYCGITAQQIEFISDTTPTKQGKLSPGAHIPVKPPSAFTDDFPDYAILFAWNHFDEINQKEHAFREAGGKWIIPIRMVEVI